VEARLAKLEADAAHIQRALSSLQADVKQVVAGVGDLRVSAATLVEAQKHLATREWVGVRAAAVATVSVGVIVAAIGGLPALLRYLGVAA